MEGAGHRKSLSEVCQLVTNLLDTHAHAHHKKRPLQTESAGNQRSSRRTATFFPHEMWVQANSNVWVYEIRGHHQAITDIVQKYFLGNIASDV